MNQPLVSIIIPHFNRTRLLAESIESVRRQTMEEWEAIVVDDGSDEDVWEKLQLFREERIRIYQRENQPKGPSACRNIGIREAKGEFIIFLDSDDLLAPWCLENRVKDFRNNPGMDFLVYPSLLFKQKPGDSNRLWNKLDKEADQLERFLYSDPPWCVTGPIWKREALVRLCGFNEDVFYGDDAELHIRAILHDFEFLVIDNVLHDNFVRRNVEGRITSGISSLILESRLTFLKIVMELLRTYKCNSRYITIWQGEFFSEIEFRLFNKHKRSIKQVYLSLKSCLSSIIFSNWLWLYCSVSSFLIDKSYLVFKTARKFFLLGFPKVYTQRRKNFCKIDIPDFELYKIFIEETSQ